MTLKKAADAIVVGAGITGLAIAREMVRRGLSVVIVDPNSPMTGTSAYSTECYRDVWHDTSMHSLVSRSIDLLENVSNESDNAFGFKTHQHGYLFVSNTPGSGSDHHFHQFAEGSTATSVRHHHDSLSSAHFDSMHSEVPKNGIDILWGSETVARSFPHVRAEAALHARRAGWIDAQQLGRYLIDDIIEKGGSFIKDEVVSMERHHTAGHVLSVTLKHCGENITTQTVVNAAGPFSGELSRVLVPSLPDPNFTNELHCKVIFKDNENVVPYNSPMVILGDETTIPWSDDEQEWIDDLASRPQEAEEAGLSKWLQSKLPSGCHVRPASNGWNVMLWEYAHHDQPLDLTQYDVQPTCRMPTFYDEHVIPNIDPMYAEMTMRAMSLFLPHLSQYIGVLGGKDVLTDGGYYTYAPDRMPVIGEVAQVPGYYMANGVAGYGIMAAMGVAELICDQHDGIRSTIDPKFDPNRLFDPTLRKQMEERVTEEASMSKAVGGSL
jgi:glycine/D-amino acid oxidase-like deaminating enzyme